MSTCEIVDIKIEILTEPEGQCEGVYTAEFLKHYYDKKYI